MDLWPFNYLSVKCVKHAAVPESQDEPILPRVPFASCIEHWGGTEEMDDYFSTALGRRTRGLKRTRFATFPPFLMVQLKRCAHLLFITVLTSASYSVPKGAMLNNCSDIKGWLCDIKRGIDALAVGSQAQVHHINRL